MNWDPIPKPAEIAETRLLDAILDGRFPIGSTLPGERDLATQIGVTRPTLREALQRLSRDGWLEIQHGKPTRVRDYWQEGSLAVLAVLARSPKHQSPDFVAYLLEVRLLLAPAYARQAVEIAADEIISLLESASALDNDPTAFAAFDWQLHHLLTQKARNPVFRLLLNGFEQLYSDMAQRYFSFPECRQHSQNFYFTLHTCVQERNLCDIEELTRQTMQASLDLWQRLQGGAA
jgi:GntR family negative regulator for fad regulon and positive regulator of fabA